MSDKKIIRVNPDASGLSDTERIQKAIDACFFEGGGTVEVGSGDYHVGCIRLRSHITLHLLENARLIGSRNTEDYFTVEKDRVEPLSAEEISDIRWIPLDKRTPEDKYSWLNTIGTTWNHAVIRAVRAEDIAIIGETGSVIDGADCYDPQGEEDYRGPHGINIHASKNITLRGYTIQNTGNWAHCLVNCENVTAGGLTVKGGHDGFDIMACRHAHLYDCVFHTGDDCVAGYGSSDIEVEHCVMNTACSAFRIGGRDIRIHDCRLYGPAEYLFRGSLSQEEKIAGNPRFNSVNGKDEAHRYNMLSAFTYFAADGIEVKDVPGNIVISDCSFENIDRFVHYNFSGNEPWQMLYPLSDIRFERISASEIKLPFTLYGDEKLPLTAVFEDITLSLSEDYEHGALIQAANYEKLKFRNFRITNAPDVFMKVWGKSGIPETENLSPVYTEDRLIERAEEEFFCPWI